MVQIELRCRPDGTLSSVRAVGHALIPDTEGFSPACAAVSSALRSTARLLASTPGIVVSGEAPQEGAFRLVVLRCSLWRRRYLLGVSATLRQLLMDLAAENPAEIQLHMNI